MHTKKYLRLIECWDDVQEIEDSSLSGVSANTNHEKLVLLLLVRVIVLSQDCFTLLKSNRGSAVPIIQRSAIESFLDMKCMIKDKDYEGVMNNSYNNYMAGLSAALGDGEEQKYRKRIVKGKSINIEGKFRKADELPLYKKFYLHLCRHAHGNLERLVIDHTINGNIVVNLEPEEERLLLMLNQVISLKAEAFKEYLSFSKCREQSFQRVKIVLEKLEAIDNA